MSSESGDFPENKGVPVLDKEVGGGVKCHFYA